MVGRWFVLGKVREGEFDAIRTQVGVVSYTWRGWNERGKVNFASDFP